MAISERSVIDATLLAVAELNAAGGVLGRPVEAVVEDGESDAATFAAKAEKLIAKDNVCAVFGCWTSASRKTVLPVFERHDHLLFYPVQYEGWSNPRTSCTRGRAQPADHPRGAVVRVEPQEAAALPGGVGLRLPADRHAIIRDQAASLGAEIVGEEYLPFGGTEVATS